MAHSLVTNHPTSIFLIPSLNQAHSDQQRGCILRKLPCPTTQEPIWQSHLHHLSWHRSPFAAAPPWGRWFLLYLSVAVTWLWHRSLSPLLCKVLAPPGLMPGASVTQSSICSLHIQPPALNDFLTLCYKRGVFTQTGTAVSEKGACGAPSSVRTPAQHLCCLNPTVPQAGKSTTIAVHVCAKYLFHECTKNHVVPWWEIGLIGLKQSERRDLLRCL